MSRIGVDTGGTFTDFVRLGPDGVVVHKLRSTPADPSRAILAGIAELTVRAAVGARASSVAADVVHGSTVATNAVLERKGARVALVTTAGFEDVVRIGRQTRPELYNIFVPPRRPIVEAELTFGVPERLDASGAVLEALDLAAVDRVAAAIQSAGADIVAVCLLHSYVNDVHEVAVADRLRKSGLAVSTSSSVLPEYREYERWSTTVVNAYVTPLIDRYLATLERELVSTPHAAPRTSHRALRTPHPARRTADLSVRLRVMQSNGGSISAAAARAQAVRTVLSGPAAGVVGARAVAAQAGISASDLLRYGRHVDRREFDRREDRDVDGFARRRFSGATAGHRHSHGGRRRRVDRRHR